MSTAAGAQLIRHYGIGSQYDFPNYLLK
jgi:hypothetical protein